MDSVASIASLSSFQFNMCHARIVSILRVISVQVRKKEKYDMILSICMNLANRCHDDESYCSKSIEFESKKQKVQSS